MYAICDLYTGEILLDRFTTEADAKRAAMILFRDRMWVVCKVAG